MGTPATSTGTITFDNAANAKKAYRLIKEFVNKANKNLFPKDNGYAGDYDITLEELAAGAYYIEFTADSGRDVNLTWQLETFNTFCQTLPGIERFDASVMVCNDGVYWSKSNNEE